MFRIVASALVIVCVILAWIFSNSTESGNVQPVGNASPNAEQAPTQNKPTNPGDKKFNF
jgi:hypothetical protein